MKAFIDDPRRAHLRLSMNAVISEALLFYFANNGEALHSLPQQGQDQASKQGQAA